MSNRKPSWATKRDTTSTRQHHAKGKRLVTHEHNEVIGTDCPSPKQSLRSRSNLTVGFEPSANLAITPHHSTDPPSVRDSPPTGSAERWRKLLYIQQDYPDNYVDASFLENLQKNVNFQSYDYFAVIRESTVITDHISSVVIFVAVFIQLYHRHLDPHILVMVGTVLTFLGVAVWEWRLANDSTAPVGEDEVREKHPADDRTSHPSSQEGAPPLRQSFMRLAIVFFLTLLGLSPILHTLTEDTSSDTIWAMSTCLIVTNILFHDYSSDPTHTIAFPGSIALNAAIFACVLLASRLSSNLHVFAFMSFALGWFALFPIFRRHLKRRLPKAHLTQTGLLVGTAFALFWPITRTLAILYILGVFCLTFLCPIWLIWIQRYKNEIHGPWDEARPKVRRYPSLY
ncbi:glycosylphosphatidylinositol anchor biosynthesis [Dispira parvispora]|uniref:Glycosylphosphatidylinositol anchor biosynthesis n=1 Tax=Dispira parvispora TaxID=1520584 RepID=A0A9W8E430_9FUNG|nr:glycosylphosphatidylinositol anchor biosynthesis [Dispira parvispora]